MLVLHPAKRATIFEILLRKTEEIEIKFSKKTSKFSCQLKTEVVVLHPL
jgi:hypothetical protein